jgi:hypothetical protein
MPPLNHFHPNPANLLVVAFNLFEQIFQISFDNDDIFFELPETVPSIAVAVYAVNAFLKIFFRF